MAQDLQKEFDLASGAAMERRGKWCESKSYPVFTENLRELEPGDSAHIEINVGISGELRQILTDADKQEIVVRLVAVAREWFTDIEVQVTID